MTLFQTTKLFEQVLFSITSIECSNKEKPLISNSMILLLGVGMYSEN